MPDVNNIERTETKAEDIPEEKPCQGAESPAYRFDKQSLEENSSTGCQLNGRRRDTFYPKALVLVFPGHEQPLRGGPWAEEYSPCEQLSLSYSSR